MAPPPPTAEMPIQERMMNLATTLQFAWFCGHAVLLLTTLRYGLSYMFFNWYGGMAVFCYRTAFLSAAATYGIVVYKAFRARAARSVATSPLSIITDENVQYLLVALLWLLSRQMPLALLPFNVYSIFHVATYTRNSILKSLYPPNAQGQAPPKPALDGMLQGFIKNHYDSSMKLVAYLEIGLWFRILGSAMLFQTGSWILIVLYTIFFRARYSQSNFVRLAVASLASHVDAAVANQGTPPAAKQVWETVKNVARQTAEATDLSKYVGGGPGAKKAQ